MTTLFIATGFIVVSSAIALAVWPLLRDDMSRAVAANDNGPDFTAMAMLGFGSALMAGVPAVSIWLRVTA